MKRPSSGSRNRREPLRRRCWSASASTNSRKLCRWGWPWPSCTTIARGQLDRAAGRMERYVGSTRLDETIAKRWASAATEVVRLHLPDPRIRGEWLQRADQILEAVEAIDHAYLSATSPRGFDQRLAQYGEALKATLAGQVSEVPKAVSEAYREWYRT